MISRVKSIMPSLNYGTSHQSRVAVTGPHMPSGRELLNVAAMLMVGVNRTREVVVTGTADPILTDLTLWDEYTV